MKTKLLILLIAIFTITISSCSKEDCTHPPVVDDTIPEEEEEEEPPIVEEEVIHHQKMDEIIAEALFNLDSKAIYETFFLAEESRYDTDFVDYTGENNTIPVIENAPSEIIDIYTRDGHYTGISRLLKLATLENKGVITYTPQENGLPTVLSYEETNHDVFSLVSGDYTFALEGALANPSVAVENPDDELVDGDYKMTLTNKVEEIMSLAISCENLTVGFFDTGKLIRLVMGLLLIDDEVKVEATMASSEINISGSFEKDEQGVNEFKLSVLDNKNASTVLSLTLNFTLELDENGSFTSGDIKNLNLNFGDNLFFSCNTTNNAIKTIVDDITNALGGSKPTLNNLDPLINTFVDNANISFNYDGSDTPIGSFYVSEEDADGNRELMIKINDQDTDLKASEFFTLENFANSAAAVADMAYRFILNK